MSTAARAAAWTGELDLASSWALFVGKGGSTRRHAHVAHKIVVSLSEDVTIDDVDALDDGVWLVRSGASHRVHANGRVALLFMDAAAFDAVALRAAQASVLAVAARLRVEPDPEPRVAAVQALVESLPRAADWRVTRAATRLVEEREVPLSTLADRSGLSRSRLAHLFVERVGVAPRRYRTWGALRRAVELLAAGHSLTSVAHEAGFSDSAHLSRSFSQMLGITPSQLAGSCVIRRR